MKNTTQKTDYSAIGLQLAINENKATAKRSVTFCTVGRDLFTNNASLADINTLADAFRTRYIAPTKQTLNEILQYIVKGFNAESTKSEVLPVVVIHCYSVKQNEAARFTFDAKPAKQPKVKTASGISDAPTGNSTPDSSNSTPEKQAAIIEAGLPININDVKNAVKNGQITLKELAQLVDELTAGKLSTLFNMDYLTDGKKKAA